MEKTVSAVLVAAGSSTRMGFDKLSFDLGGETVLHRSIRAFAQCPQVTELVLVAGKNRDFVAQQAADCPKPVQIVAGGATRAESAKNGVLAAHGELVAVHDAARPFVSAAVITAALEAAARCGAAAPAVPVKDTIKAAARGDGKTVPPDCAVQTTPDRSTLYAVQTPQCFDRAAYLAALAELDATRARLVTDDCSLFELTGRPVQLTQGDYANLKITTREDLPRPAQRKETEMRIGHGYDVHRLVEQRKLILGGVEIPFEKGLLGHSDADVLTHAVEGFTAAKAGAFTDLFAQEAFRIAYGSLPASFAGRQEVRLKLHMASCMAGVAFSQAGLGLCHAMAHSLGGRFHVPHGRLNAILLPAVIENNASSCGKKYAQLARAAGMGGSADTVALRNLKNGLIRLRRELGLPQSLTQAGVAPGKIWGAMGEIVESVLGDPCCKTNPIPVEDFQVRRILEEVTGHL